MYRRLHPVKWCKGFRASWWSDRHYLRSHVGVWLWVHVVPARARWAVAEWIGDRFDRCWCDLVDSCYRADDWDIWRNDYEDLCDFPAPWQAGKPRPGWCYCAPPPEQRRAA